MANNLLAKTVALAALFMVFACSDLPAQKLVTQHPVYHIKPNSITPAQLQHRAVHRGRSTTQTCDTMVVLDYNQYNEEFAYENSLNFNGSWYVAQPEVLAQEFTSFIDFDHEFEYSYLISVYDSLAFADLTGHTTAYVPKAQSTIYIDSLGMFIGISGDTSHGGPMEDDSLIFGIYTIDDGTLSSTPIKSLVFTGVNQLAPFLTGPNYLGYVQIGVNQQLALGQTFAVGMEYHVKDTSSHLLLSYTYADSCGTFVYQGNTYSSPAYPSPFIINSYYGDITDDGTDPIVSDENNAFGYSIPGLADNCSFVYTQNFEILPIVTICTNFSATITASATEGCPGSVIDLTANAFGTSSNNLVASWSATGGTLTSNNNPTTSLILGPTGDATVVLTVSDGSNLVRDTLVIANNGIGVSITNSNPVVLTCGSGSTINAQISGVQSGRNFTWSTGAHGSSASSVTASTPGNYSVTVTNAAGCSASAGVNAVYQGLSNSVSFIAPTPICATIGAGFINTSTNTAGWNSHWDFGNGFTATTTNVTYGYPNAGSYTITLTMDSAGCSFAPVSQTVTVLASSDGQCASLQLPPTVTFSGTTSVCNGSIVTPSTTVINGATPYSYAWSATGDALDCNNCSKPSVTISQNSTYTVTVTDVNGLTGTATISYTVSGGSTNYTINASGPATFCSGGSITLTGASGIAGYQWLLNGSNLQGETNSTLTVTDGGAYQLVYTGSGCTATSNIVNVTVKPLPNASITPAGPFAVCDGNAVGLTAGSTTGGVTYQWLMNGTDAGNTSQYYSADATGAYKAVVTGSNGCSDTTAAVVVTVNPLPTVALTLAPAAACAGADPVILSGGTPLGGVYSGNGVTAGSFNPAQGAGTYPVVYEYIDANACYNSATGNFTVNALPTVGLSGNPDTVCINGGAVALTGGTPAGGMFSGTGVNGASLDPTAVTGSTATVTYTYTDNNNCRNSATEDIQLKTCLGVNQVNVDAAITIYPNPAKDQLTIQSALFNSSVQPAIYYVTGKLVIASFSRGADKITFNTANLSAGSYMVRMVVEGQTVTRKFVKID